MNTEELNKRLKKVSDDDLDRFLDANAKMQVLGAAYEHDYKFESGSVVAITRKGQTCKNEACL